MPLSLSVTVQARKDLLWREVDGEVVLLDPGRGLYYGIEGCGTQVWELLQKKTTLQKIVSLMQSELDVDKDTLKKDVLRFSEELAESSLIEVFSTQE